MDPKQILVVLHAGAPSEAALRLAAILATRYGAEVEGVCLFDDPAPAIADSYAVGPAGIAAVLEHRSAKIREVIAPHAAAFRRTITEAGLGESWRTGEACEWTDALVRRARLADLVVISPAPDLGSMRRLIEALAFASGAPVLLAPADGLKTLDFDKVLVAWNGSREARRALDESLDFLKAAGQVRIVVVGEGTAVVDDNEVEALRHRLALHGVEAEVRRVASGGKPTGRVLMAASSDFGADLLVMGAYSHSRAEEAILGGATRAVLAHADIPTLLAH